MEVAVFNSKGKKTDKKVSLEDAIFALDPNDHAIYLDTKLIMANKRGGNHKTKERGEITGSRRKIKKQKGTGTARAGDIKNPLFRGGGTIFGPRPRSYSFGLNKKVKQLARKSALSYKAKDKNITVLEELKFDRPQTKEYASILKNLKLEGSSLLVLPESDRNVVLSARNIPKVKITTVQDLNTYDILNCKHLIIAENAVDKLNKTFSK